jgi:hypothetical protein
MDTMAKSYRDRACRRRTAIASSSQFAKRLIFEIFGGEKCRV